MFRKVAVIAVSAFGTTMSAEIQALLLILILMICCGLQHIGQPFEILGISKRRYRILPGLELSALVMLLLTLWSGLMMFKLNDSNETNDMFVHTLLTVVIVIANIVFLLVLLFILIKEILYEKKESIPELVQKLERISSNVSMRFSTVNLKGTLSRIRSRSSISTKDDVESGGQGDDDTVGEIELSSTRMGRPSLVSLSPSLPPRNSGISPQPALPPRSGGGGSVNIVAASSTTSSGEVKVKDRDETRVNPVFGIAYENRNK